MKKRGFFALLAAIPGWAYFYFAWVRPQSRLGDAIGTIYMVPSPPIRTVLRYAELATIGGIALLIYDFVRLAWKNPS